MVAVDHDDWRGSRPLKDRVDRIENPPGHEPCLVTVSGDVLGARTRKMTAVREAERLAVRPRRPVGCEDERWVWRQDVCEDEVRPRLAARVLQMVECGVEFSPVCVVCPTMERQGSKRRQIERGHFGFAQAVLFAQALVRDVKPLRCRVIRSDRDHLVTRLLGDRHQRILLYQIAQGPPIAAFAHRGSDAIQVAQIQTRGHREVGLRVVALTGTWNRKPASFECFHEWLQVEIVQLLEHIGTTETIKDQVIDVGLRTCGTSALCRDNALDQRISRRPPWLFGADRSD